MLLGRNSHVFFPQDRPETEKQRATAQVPSLSLIYIYIYIYVQYSGVLNQTWLGGYQKHIRIYSYCSRLTQLTFSPKTNGDKWWQSPLPLPTGYLDVIQVVRWWHLGHRLQQGRHVSWAKLLKQRAEPRNLMVSSNGHLWMGKRWGKWWSTMKFMEIRDILFSDMESDYGILPYFTKAIGRSEQQWAPGLGACPPRATEQHLLASKGLIHILTKIFLVWRCYFNILYIL